MPNEEIALECLRLALAHGHNPEGAVALARDFLAFVLAAAAGEPAADSAA